MITQSCLAKSSTKIYTNYIFLGNYLLFHKTIIICIDSGLRRSDKYVFKYEEVSFLVMTKVSLV